VVAKSQFGQKLNSTLKHPGTGPYYLLTAKDKDGHALDGARNYRLNVPANAPVKQYWSATAYDRDTHALVRNVPRPSRSSQSQSLRKESDGSATIYFGPQASAGQESNWYHQCRRKVRSPLSTLRHRESFVRQDLEATRHRGSEMKTAKFLLSFVLALMAVEAARAQPTASAIPRGDAARGRAWRLIASACRWTTATDR
jgi:hypothetical protein